MLLEEAKAALDKAYALDRLLSKEILDVSPGQALILAYMDGPCTVGHVKHWGTNPSYNITHLCAHGYLRKSEPEHDLRGTVVAVTPKGTALAEKVRKVIEEAAL